MNRMRKAGWLAAGLMALGWLGVGESQAAVGTPSRLNIDVTITATRSVSVDGQASSTNTVTWDTANPNDPLINPAGSSVTVKNDSNVVEKWALATLAASINTQTPGGTTWSLAGSSYAVGANEFSVQAVFGSSRTAAGSCPTKNHADWNAVYSSTLTTTNQTYTNVTFANSSLNQDGDGSNFLYNPDVGASGNMFASSLRTLCYRVVPPSSTSTSETQNVQVIVSAIP